ncbi:hypothetical protein CIP107566_01570 [Corynebacterium diphtheriae]|nr:hypothetical protein CIP107566_01570 [Corynebacterium diphtheriae]
MQVGGLVDQPVIAGVLGAQVKLVADGDLVLHGGTVIEIIEHGGYARAGMAGDNRDVGGVGAGERIRLVIGSVRARLIHGLRINRAVEHAAIARLELRVELQVRDVELHRGRRLNDWGGLGDNLALFQTLWRLDGLVDGAGNGNRGHNADGDAQLAGTPPRILGALRCGL